MVGGGQSNLPGVSCIFQFNLWTSSSDKLQLQSWSSRVQLSNVRVMPGREIQGKFGFCQLLSLRQRKGGWQAGDANTQVDIGIEAERRF